MLQKYTFRFRAQLVLDCDQARIKAAQREEEIKKGLKNTSSLCRASIEGFANFTQKHKSDRRMLEKYTEMLSIGETKEACEPVHAFMNEAESVRLDLVGCVKSISEDAPADQIEVRKLALVGAQNIGLMKIGISQLTEVCF